MNMNIGFSDDDYHNIPDAIHKCKSLQFNCLQVFLGSKSLTTCKEKFNPSPQEIKHIRHLLSKYQIQLFIHGLLRLNFCNDPSHKKFAWGLENLLFDMHVGHSLGAKGVVIHAGRYITKHYQITKEECYHHFIGSLQYVLDRSMIDIYLETPAHTKNTVFSTIDEMADLYHQIPPKYKKRIGICIDTCHIFVAGYDISTRKGALAYFQLFDKKIGLAHCKLIHLNDSLGELNSHLNRHAPLGKGYIFQKRKGGLKVIIETSNKYGIPLILETNKETYQENKKFIESTQSGGNKEKIIQIFEDILDYYKTLGNKSNQFRVSSYEKTIRDLKKLPKINSMFNLENSKLTNKTKEKIKTILDTGHLPLHNSIQENHNKIKILWNLQSVYGIGPIFAKELYKQNIKSVNELKKSKTIKLTDAQTLALRYHNDLIKKIPHHEITQITKILREKLKNYDVELINAGSYAMNKKESGDIDYIIVMNKPYPMKKIMKDILIENNFYKGNLLDGKKKDIYVIKVNAFPVRQMDVLYVSPKEKYFAILYFSSSKDFSKKIRLIASKKGYILNEKGLFTKDRKRVPFHPISEKEIFDFLEEPYTLPKNRE